MLFYVHFSVQHSSHSLGLLDDEDGDLGALEKKLTEKSRQASMADVSSPPSPAHTATGPEIKPSPQTNPASPDPNRDRDMENTKNEERESTTPGVKEEEVEALSEMMCSLVTNQCGETRYIGMTFPAPLLF